LARQNREKWSPAGELQSSTIGARHFMVDLALVRSVDETAVGLFAQAARRGFAGMEFGAPEKSRIFGRASPAGGDPRLPNAPPQKLDRVRCRAVHFRRTPIFSTFSALSPETRFCIFVKQENSYARSSDSTKAL
jgi:hypothetical protein